VTAYCSTPQIAVVGSANLDLVVEVPRLPLVGESVLGGDLSRIPGGKGANQAVAAARLGRSVAMIGRVGDDEGGRMLRAALKADGVDTAHLTTTPDTPNGVALIAVGADGDNSIVVSPGANNRLSVDDVAAAADVLSGRMLTNAYRIDEQRFALGFSTNNALNIQGFHAAELLAAFVERLDEGVDFSRG